MNPPTVPKSRIYSLALLFLLLLAACATPAQSQATKPTALPTLTAAAGSASINGWLWHDLCDSGKDGETQPSSTPSGCIASPSPLGSYRADGLQDPQEPTIGGVVIDLGSGSCPSTGMLQFTTVASDLSYSFVGLRPGVYCVSINPSEEPNLSLLRPGLWTYPLESQGTISTTVALKDGEQKFDVNFGWDYQFKP